MEKGTHSLPEQQFVWVRQGKTEHAAHVLEWGKNTAKVQWATRRDIATVNQSDVRLNGFKKQVRCRSEGRAACANSSITKCRGQNGLLTGAGRSNSPGSLFCSLDAQVTHKEHNGSNDEWERVEKSSVDRTKKNVENRSNLQKSSQRSDTPVVCNTRTTNRLPLVGSRVFEICQAESKWSPKKIQRTQDRCKTLLVGNRTAGGSKSKLVSGEANSATKFCNSPVRQQKIAPSHERRNATTKTPHENEMSKKRNRSVSNSSRRKNHKRNKKSGKCPPRWSAERIKLVQNATLEL